MLTLLRFASVRKTIGGRAIDQISRKNTEAQSIGMDSYPYIHRFSRMLFLPVFKRAIPAHRQQSSYLANWLRTYRVLFRGDAAQGKRAHRMAVVSCIHRRWPVVQICAGVRRSIQHHELHSAKYPVVSDNRAALLCCCILVHPQARRQTR